MEPVLKRLNCMCEMKRFKILFFCFWVLNTNAQGLKILAENELSAVFKSSSKPVIINFWATWCVPCVEEMPLFVKADSVYSGKVDFVFVSFDMKKDSNRVKQKIADLRIPGNQYLVKVNDMDALINGIDSLWGGALPVTWRAFNGKRMAHYESFEQFEDLIGFIDDNIKKEE
jgi:thiol-disulfide isomerase/thioredoxin